MKRVVAFDTETSLIRPGCNAPPISCMSYQTVRNASGRWTDTCIWTEPKLVHWTDALPLLREWLTDPDTIIVGHNVPFDLAVICAEWPELVPLVFRALDEDRITDTRTRSKLLDIAHGCYRGMLGEDNKWIKLGYTLLELAKRLAGIPIKKEGFRFFYGPLRDVPLERWVEAAKDLQRRGQAYLAGEHDADLSYLSACLGDEKKFRTEIAGMIAADANEVISYPLDDARSTLAVFLAQERERFEGHEDNEEIDLLEDQWRQSRAMWWLHLASAWGLRTNAAGVSALQLQTQRLCEDLEKRLIEEGLIRADGSRDTKAAKARMLAACGWHWDEGLGRYEPDNDNARPLRLTDSGEPSLDSDACKACDDEVLKAYAEITSLKATLNKDVPALARGVVFPVHTNFDLAGTGRRTSSNPNVQNWRRLPGIRECFVPRPGRVFAQADYSGLELATLAQACLAILGYSTLADALNAGLDPHTALACSILGIEYEEGIARKDKSHPLHHDFDQARQTAKVANFGFPGGLGAPKLVLFARKSYGVELTEDQARELKRQWLAKWREMRDYFNAVSSLQGEDGLISIRQLRSNRVRGGITYTEACNSFFQGLGADATAHAGWLIAKACYTDPSSPLFGARIVNYVHDELILECDIDRAPEAAEELSRLMVLGASEWIPNIKLQAEPCLMTVWSKDAKTLRDTRGRLIPWSPPMKAAA